MLLRNLMAAVLFTVCAFSTLSLPRVVAGAQSDRKQAERDIRRMISEIGFAQKTGDVETVKKLTARRALALYRFAFNALLAKALVPVSPDDPAPGAPSPEGEGDEALSFFFSLAGEATGKAMTPEQIREMVRVEAERPITFIDDRTARIYEAEGAAPVFAVFEGGRWKMDDTESVKAALLDADKGGAAIFTPEQRERIKKF